jgi:hypothetical protein
LFRPAPVGAGPSCRRNCRLSHAVNRLPFRPVQPQRKRTKGAKTSSRAHEHYAPGRENREGSCACRERCESIEADPSAQLGIGRGSATNPDDLIFVDQRLGPRSHNDELSDVIQSRKALSAEILVYPAILLSANVIRPLNVLTPGQTFSFWAETQETQVSVFMQL